MSDMNGINSNKNYIAARKINKNTPSITSIKSLIARNNLTVISQNYLSGDKREAGNVNGYQSIASLLRKLASETFVTHGRRLDSYKYLSSRHVLSRLM